jgi:hypothetical protein
MLGLSVLDLGAVLHERPVIGVGLVVAVLGGGSLAAFLKRSAGDASSMSM